MVPDDELVGAACRRQPCRSGPVDSPIASPRRYGRELAISNRTLADGSGCLQRRAHHLCGDEIEREDEITARRHGPLVDSEAIDSRTRGAREAALEQAHRLIRRLAAECVGM